MKFSSWSATLDVDALPPATEAVERGHYLHLMWVTHALQWYIVHHDKSLRTLRDM